MLSVQNSSDSLTKPVPSVDYEQPWWGRGLLAAGVDEAGRGALAGPVVASAVVLDPQRIPLGLADSKTLSQSNRIKVSEQIINNALAIGIGVVDHQTIDSINILQATFRAMHMALDQIAEQCAGQGPLSHVFVDGNRFAAWHVPHTCIVRGDACCSSIAAASIIAKTTRDAIMTGDIHPAFPQYGFNKHMGYGTVVHRTMLKEQGPCAFHRITFLSRILS